MSNVKVLIKKHKIPEYIKGKNYNDDNQYREDFKEWIDVIWDEKDRNIEKLKF